jgi:hypothetical protein
MTNLLATYIPGKMEVNGELQHWHPLSDQLIVKIFNPSSLFPKRVQARAIFFKNYADFGTPESYEWSTKHEYKEVSVEDVGIPSSYLSYFNKIIIVHVEKCTISTDFEVQKYAIVDIQLTEEFCEEIKTAQTAREKRRQQHLAQKKILWAEEAKIRRDQSIAKFKKINMDPRILLEKIKNLQPGEEVRILGEGFLNAKEAKYVRERPCTFEEGEVINPKNVHGTWWRRFSHPWKSAPYGHPGIVIEGIRLPYFYYQKEDDIWLYHWHKDAFGSQEEEVMYKYLIN